MTKPVKRAVQIGLGLVIGFFIYAHYAVRLSESLLPDPPEHGLCLTIEADIPAEQIASGNEVLKEVIRRRFWAFNRQIFWEQVSPGKFRVYVPIVKRELLDEAIELISHRGLMEVGLVHVQNENLTSTGRGAEGYELLEMNSGAHHGKYLVSKVRGERLLLGIHQAIPKRGQKPGINEIQFKLTPDSAELFRQFTRQYVGRRSAILVDGELLVTPTITAEISTGQAVIAGKFEVVEMVALASQLNCPLPFSIKLLDTQWF